MAKEFTPQEALGGDQAAGQAMPSFPFPPNAMNPFMNFEPADVEKKIGEFKAVETWLNMQIGMLQMTIKTMEMQKSSLEALRAQTQNPGATAQGKSGKEK